MAGLVAVIDLGSNSIKMTISETVGQKITTVRKFRDTVRLSEGMGKREVISDGAMERAIDSITALKHEAEQCRCEKIIAIATAAVRRAENKEEFLKKSADAGVEFRVLSEWEEAYYGFLGVMAVLPFKDFVILDVGGGSSEISLVRNGELVKSRSMPFGAVVLSEMVKEDAMNGFVLENIENIDFIDECAGLRIIGLGGTADAACKMFSKDEISFDELCRGYEKIKNTPVEMRGEIDGVPDDRGDIILGGMSIIKTFAERISSGSLRMCKSGIRDGILREGCR